MPCGSIVVDADLACGIQNDNSAVPIQPLFQIVHGFLRGPFRELPAAIRSAVHLRAQAS